MSNIKIIYFDSVGIDAQTLENKLRSECKSIYIIKDGLAIINYDGTAQKLFDTIFAPDNRYNVFIHDLDTSENSYWGFMNRDLWKWLKEQQ